MYASDNEAFLHPPKVRVINYKHLIKECVTTFTFDVPHL